MRMIKKVCLICGKAFERPFRKNRESNYCSKECGNTSKQRLVSCKCENCGKVFQRSPSGVKEHLFCSRECALPTMSERMTVLGQKCKKEDAKIRHPLHKTWWGIRNRCLNPNHIHYPLYGARGITICDRWLHSFENFVADMGEKPTKAHTIDRENNDGNYEPGNCRWATKAEQAANRRKKNCNA